jgi:hypothetical protein
MSLIYNASWYSIFGRLTLPLTKIYDKINLYSLKVMDAIVLNAIADIVSGSSQ